MRIKDKIANLNTARVLKRKVSMKATSQEKKLKQVNNHPYVMSLSAQSTLGPDLPSPSSVLLMASSVLPAGSTEMVADPGASVYGQKVMGNSLVVQDIALGG